MNYQIAIRIQKDKNNLLFFYDLFGDIKKALIFAFPFGDSS
jgi:hypothetical protein